MTSTDARSVHVGVPWPPEAPFSSLFGLFRHVALGGLSGLVAGILVGGIGGRLFMRIAGAASGSDGAGRTTEAGFTVGEITFGDTLGLVLFIGIFSGIMGAAIYLALRPWCQWAGRWRGVVIGVLLFALASATSDLMNPDNIDFLILGNSALLVAMIFVLFIAFGVVVDATFGFLDARLPDQEVGWRTIGALYVALTAVGVLAVGSVGSASLFGGEGICGCEAPLAASWSFVVVFFSTLAFWIASVIARPLEWVTNLSVTFGYVGTVGVLVFGLARALSDTAEIIA